MLRKLLYCLIALLAFSGNAWAQVSPAPAFMNFQGRLTRSDGTPIADGGYSLRFSLWTAVSGGAEKWNQTINPVTVRNGAFAVLLDVSGGPADLFDSDRWLEIKIGTDTPLTPRQRLVSVAFALKANTVPDSAITSAKIATGAVTSAKIADGSITNAKIGSAAVTGAKVADNTLTGVKLVDGAITTAKVADGTITTAKIANGAVTAAKLAAGLTFPPSGPAGGDLTGTYPNPLIAENAIGSSEIINYSVGNEDLSNNAVNSYKLLYDPLSLYRVSGGRLMLGDAPQIDQRYSSDNSNVGSWGWQSFTPFTNDYLVLIGIKCGTTTGSAISTTLKIYSGEGTGGTLLRTQDITVNPTVAFQYWRLESPALLTGGTKYTFYIGSTSGLTFRYDSTGSYSGGRADISSGADYYFSTYMAPFEDHDTLFVDTPILIGDSGVIGAGISVVSNYGDGIYAATYRSGSAGIFASDNGVTGAYAGKFSGNVVMYDNLTVNGTLTKGAGAFKIDHPLDPANKTLAHSFVESPDMMNIYNGNVTTDKRGVAVVTLPRYFDALNKDFRYQLTPIGSFAQAIIQKEIANNRFVIRTSKPKVKVSWQVTGIRNDAYARSKRIKVEENKPADQRGTYLFPTGAAKPTVRAAGR